MSRVGLDDFRDALDTDWQPVKYTKDPTVNALLNIASGLFKMASATREVAGGLKHESGQSVAEVMHALAEAANLSAMDSSIADAIDRLAEKLSPRLKVKE